MQGAVASPHALATKAGAAALESGGNAIDAALAAAAMLTVVYPHQCALGGDLFAVVASRDGKSRAINGSGAAAARLNVAEVRSRFEQMPDSGPIPITVPGLPGGWQALREVGASRPFSTLLAPAIAAARDGVAVSRSLENGIRRRLSVVRQDPGLAAMFLADGQPLLIGTMFRQPELAQTLERLATQGLQDFYKGGVANELVSALQRYGSPLDLNDFRTHSVRIESPLSLGYDDVQLETSPPNSQGFVLLEALAAVQAAGVPRDSPARMRSLLRALILATEDRERYLGDPIRRPVPVEMLIEPGRLRARMHADEIDVHNSVMRNIPAHGDTVAVCCMDENGLAVSLIQSVFQLFGCGILEPRTGIIFHNRGRGFSLATGAPNELVPATRPAHTLTPLVIRRDRQPVAAVGCMGGRAQPQILAQILSGVLDRHTPLSQTLGAPRWVFGSRDIDFPAPTIAIEANAPAEWDHIMRTPEFDLQRIEALSELVGHTQVVRIGIDGALEGASDPRADGGAAVVRG